jgi:glutaconate CoA-transferase subunit A
MNSVLDINALAALVPDGSLLSWPADHTGPPVALAHALVRRSACNLRLRTILTSGYSADILIGAGCVAEVETSGISLNEFGRANRFARASKSGTLLVKDAASSAAQPDFACFHAALADTNGNVWIGSQEELRAQANAATATLVTVEAYFDGDLLADDAYAASTIPAQYITAIALAPKGAWPCGFWYEDQPVDEAQMNAYAKASRTDEGFEEYLDANVFQRPVPAE